jgi:hypothetical protein
MCGCDAKTVKRALERPVTGGLWPDRKQRARNYDVVGDVVAKRVASTKARITAKRCCPRPGRLVMRAWLGTSAAWWPRRRGIGGLVITGGAVQRCGHRESVW